MRLTAAAALFLVGCTWLDVVVQPPPPTDPEACPPLTDPRPVAQVWFAVRMSRNVVGLAPTIDALSQRIVQSIMGKKTLVSHVFYSPLVTETNTPDTFFFASCEAPPPSMLPEVLRFYASPMTEHNKDGCELEPLTRVGPTASTLHPSYPSALLQSAPPPDEPFFNRTPAYVLVVLIDPQAREHSYAQCRVNGQPLADYFSGPWTDLAAPERTYFLSIGTNETDEGAAAFAQICLEMPGFPTAAIDGLSPSMSRFFTDFTKEMNEQRAEHAFQIEMCAALSNDGYRQIEEVIRKIHFQQALPLGP